MPYRPPKDYREAYAGPFGRFTFTHQADPGPPSHLAVRPDEHGVYVITTLDWPPPGAAVRNLIAQALSEQPPRMAPRPPGEPRQPGWHTRTPRALEPAPGPAERPQRPTGDKP